MGHSVRLVIGSIDAVNGFIRAWPGARAVALLGGWHAIPLEDKLHEAIAARWPNAQPPDELDVAPPGIREALAEATKLSGALAYLETEYWGGSGEQSAMAWSAGQEVFPATRSRGAGGPINSALRAVGVVRSETDDEFDTVGLGLRRSMSDYEPEGPLRLRGKAEAAAPEVTERTLPLWVVLALVAMFIGLGVAMSMTR